MFLLFFFLPNVLFETLDCLTCNAPSTSRAIGSTTAQGDPAGSREAVKAAPLPSDPAGSREAVRAAHVLERFLRRANRAPLIHTLRSGLLQSPQDLYV